MLTEFIWQLISSFLTKNSVPSVVLIKFWQVPHKTRFTQKYLFMLPGEQGKHTCS